MGSEGFMGPIRSYKKEQVDPKGKELFRWVMLICMVISAMITIRFLIFIW
jgi:hypothetical protein